MSWYCVPWREAGCKRPDLPRWASWGCLWGTCRPRLDRQTAPLGSDPCPLLATVLQPGCSLSDQPLRLRLAPFGLASSTKTGQKSPDMLSSRMLSRRMVNCLALTVTDKDLDIFWGDVMCSEIAEGKCNVMIKIQGVTLGNVRAPQALNSTAGAHLTLVIRVYRGSVLHHQ